MSELRRINYFVEWYLQLFHVSRKSFEVFEWLLSRKMRYYARKSEENWTFWIFEKACQNRVFPDNLDFFAATIYPLKCRWGGSSKFFYTKWKVWSSPGLKDNFLWQFSNNNENRKVLDFWSFWIFSNFFGKIDHFWRPSIFSRPIHTPQNVDGEVPQNFFTESGRSELSRV